MSQQGEILDVLNDGPATSGDVSIETGRCHRICSAVLHKLWRRGEIERGDKRMVREGLAGAYLYFLPEHSGAWRGALGERNERRVSA